MKTIINKYSIILIGVFLLGCDIVNDDPDLIISADLNAVKNNPALWNITESIPSGATIQVVNSPAGDIEIIEKGNFLLYNVIENTLSNQKIDNDNIIFNIINKGEQVGTGVLSINLLDENEDEICGVLPWFDKNVKVGEKFEFSFTEEEIFCETGYASALISLYGSEGMPTSGSAFVGSSNDNILSAGGTPTIVGPFEFIMTVSSFSSSSPFIAPNKINLDTRLELHSFLVSVNAK